MTGATAVAINPKRIAVTIAQHNERIIKGKFAFLVLTTFTKLQVKLITGESLRTYLVAFYGTNTHFDADKFVRKCINQGLSLSEVFDAINKRGLWDYMNYGLLQSIIEQFLSEDTETSDMLIRYQKDISGYFLATSIEEYIKNAQSEKQYELHSELLPLPSPDKNLFTVLLIKIKGVDVTQQSLAYINQLWKSLANQISLPLQMLLLRTVGKGCIVITWLIPSYVVPHVIKRVGENSNYFEEEYIIKVVVDHRCIYPKVFEEERESTSQEAAINEV